MLLSTLPGKTGIYLLPSVLVLLIRLYDVPARAGAAQWLLVAAILFVEGQLLCVILGKCVPVLHLEQTLQLLQALL